MAASLRRTDAESRARAVGPPSARPKAPFTVTAIIAAYNEADIIEQVIGDLVRQRVAVYLIDHGSTDGTAAAAEPYLGRGLLAIEHLPASPGEAEEGGRVSWENVLRRKEQLAAELASDWFIHHDADEFRESPWPHLDLLEAIRQVDLFGYNAIDFELLNFWPTHDRFRPGEDVREAFPHYEPGAVYDKVQVRCWKKGAAPVDLASSGGHEAVFPARRVFPLRFILRHYPIRGQEHGRRKVLGERRGRFLESEHARGWHLQYDGLREGDTFLRDPSTLTPYDPAAVRLQLVLNHRGVEDLLQTPAARERAALDVERETARLGRELDGRNREVERLAALLDARNREVSRLAEESHTRSRELDQRNQELERLGQELDGRNREVERLAAELDHRNREQARTALALDERNRQAERLAADLDRQNREVERLGQELDRRNRELERMGIALDQRNRQTAALAADVDRQNHEVLRLGVELDARNREVQRLGVDLDRQNHEVLRLGVELDAANREVQRLGVDLDRQNHEALRLGGDLDAANHEVQRLGVDLDRQNHEVLRLGVELDAANREVQRLGVDLDRQNREVDRLGRDLDAGNRESQRLGLELDRRNRAAEQLREDLRSARQRLQELEQQIAATEATVARLRGEVDEGARRLQAVLSSRTWRWSGPLRAFAGAVRGRRDA